jgi:hypothetical protein
MGILKLYNRDSNGFADDTSMLGGLPLYVDDIFLLENNSMLFGLYSMLKGWSCVLSGCLVDNLNTSTKTLSMTEGLILINDLIYYVPAITNQSYPFSFIKGTETIDSRGFQDGNVKDVATSYDYAIKTSFTYIAGNNYPTNIISEEIYFDPFTTQRAEYILSNSNKASKELLITESNFFNITKTETGKNIVGGSLSAFTNNQFRWKYYGYSMIDEHRVLRSSGLTTLVNGGADTLTLKKGNVPAHKQGLGSLVTDSQGISFRIPLYVNDSDRGGGSSLFSLDDQVPKDTTHSHAILGDTGDGTADGLKISPDPITILPAYRSSYFFHWIGYTDTLNSMNGYQFWNRPIKYNNM